MSRESTLAHITTALALTTATHPDAEALTQAWLAEHKEFIHG